MKIIWLTQCLVAAAAVLFPFFSAADYPSARANHNLKQELEGDTDRLIPQFEKFTFAVDGDVWQRSLGKRDFYHGFGYWLQLRSEVRPTEFFILNTRTIVYSGSSSNGYVEAFGFYNLLGVTGVWPEKILGSTLKIRMSDIERQTFGQGLLVQDREMNGAIVILENPYVKWLLRVDSTGAFVYSDDLWNTEFSFFGGWLGAGTAQWTQEQNVGPLTFRRAPYYYVTSGHDLGPNFNFALEGGRRGEASAYMVALGARAEWSWFKAVGKLEHRFYEDRFGEDFVGQIQQQYISYDQYDKAFTNAMNVFVRDDDVRVSAAHLNLNVMFNPRWRLESLNEIGVFDYEVAEDRPYYFYRAGLTHCPLDARQDCINLFVSSKVLVDSYRRPPGDLALANSVMFQHATFFGLDANFRF